MNSDDKQKLWDEYSKKKTAELREKIILEYVGLVKVVAGRLSIYLGYHVEYDDLVGYGTFGLIDAIDKYDFNKGVKFETYASLRIRGAILDHIRRMDWIPRTLRQKQRQLDAAYAKIEGMTGRLATDEELAAELNITSDELDAWQTQTKVSNLISLDEYMEQGDVKVEPGGSEEFKLPERIVERNEIKQMLVDTLKLLTEKEKMVITLYYYEDMTLKEISKILDVSESRISQLHTKALQKMRTKLGDNYDMLVY